jgi:hypothetical protein
MYTGCTYMLSNLLSYDAVCLLVFLVRYLCDCCIDTMLPPLQVLKTLQLITICTSIIAVVYDLHVQAILLLLLAECLCTC